MAMKCSKILTSTYFLLELALIPFSIFFMLNQHLSGQNIYHITSMAMTLGSIILCILMTYACMTERIRHIRLHNQFTTMVFLCGFNLWIDLISQALDISGMPGTNMLISVIYYMIGVDITYVFMMYELTILNQLHNPRYKTAIWIMRLITIIGNVLIIADFWQPIFFYIDEFGRYSRTSTFWLSYITPFALIIFTVYVALRENKIGIHKGTMTLFWAIPLITTMVQMFIKDMSVQYSGYTVSLMLIYYFIHSELDTIKVINRLEKT